MKKVIVIGTGIVGAVTGYELARRGVDVTMIDAQKPGQATAAAAGIISPWMTKRRNQAWYKLATKGAAYYETFIQDLANDGEKHTGYQRVGGLRLHTDETKLLELADIVKERKSASPEIGDITLLDESQVQKLVPFLKEGYVGLFISGAARVDGRALTSSLCHAAQKHGAAFIKGQAALLRDGSEVVGVTVGGQQIEADMTIATNGVWMPELLADSGHHLKISSQKGEIVHLHTTQFDTDSLPVVMPPSSQYILPFENGRIVVGATHWKAEQVIGTPKITVGGIHTILNEALLVAPSLAKATLMDTRAGYRPYTFNHLPVFGTVPFYERLLVANGLGASGLSTGPFIGNQLAKMVIGEQLDIDIEPYNVAQIISSTFV